MKTITKEQFKKVVGESVSKSDVCRAFGWPINGTGMRTVSQFAEKFQVPLTHFSQKAVNERNRRWEIIEKECPVCGDLFEAQKGHPKEKMTCGYACSNTYFRTGPKNGQWKERNSSVYSSYRTTCFYYHGEQCIICGEKEVVDAHHLDGDRSNNVPENLIPLCPTHHCYIHRGKSHLIQEQINEYIHGISLCRA